MKHENQTETEGGSLQPLILRRLAGDAELMEVGRKAVENELVEWRDNTRFMPRNNGLTIRNRDGSESGIVRFGPEVGVAIALRAIAEHLETKAQNDQAHRSAPGATVERKGNDGNSK